ncbi:MAG: polysaccharide biosynthesis protein, partial [Angelakisella sp.]
MFSSAYNIYAFLLVISSAGLPVAISRMVSEANALGRRREVKKIARLSIAAFAIIGAALSLAMIFGADAFARLVGNSMSRIAVMVLGPSIFFVAVLSAIRGYYQGLSNMIPTATSQVIEALGKLIAGLGLAYVFAKLGYSVEVVVAGAIGGVTIGTLLSTVYLVAIRLRDLQSKKGVELGGECSQSRDILKKMLKIAIPITLGASIIAITNFVDGINVMRRLQDGCMMTEPEANYLFGLLFNASKLFNLPQTLIAGIGVSVIPAITVAFTKKQGLQATKFTESAFRLTSILALPCAVGLGMLAEPILRLVFIGSKRSELADTAPILTVLSLAILSVSLVAVSVSVLQAMGKEKIPVFSMIIGGAIKIGANYVLIGTP